MKEQLPYSVTALNLDHPVYRSEPLQLTNHLVEQFLVIQLMEFDYPPAHQCILSRQMDPFPVLSKIHLEPYRNKIGSH